MSESNNVGGHNAGITAVAGSVVLPFTGGHSVVTYTVVVAIGCALIVIASRIVRQLIARN